jgi:hypothetical protein
MVAMAALSGVPASLLLDFFDLDTKSSPKKKCGAVCVVRFTELV